MASRHLARALVLQTLFECDMTSVFDVTAAKKILKRNGGEFDLDAPDRAFAESLLLGALQKQSEVDAVISKAAPQWPIDKIAPIDRNVLRIGLYELLFGDRVAVPPKVALNEAIELGKSFGGEQSGKFVNGVLGAVYRDIGEPQKEDAQRTAAAAEFLGGAVVLCRTGSTTLVALVHDAFHHWTLPKARCQEGELTQGAAKRAIREELGIDAEIVTTLSEHTYTAHDPARGPVPRTVSYFLATVDKKVALKCQVCEGITDAKWYDITEIVHLPLYDDLRAIIEQGITKLETV